MRHLLVILLLLFSPLISISARAQDEAAPSGSTETYTGFMDDRQPDTRYPVTLQVGDQLTVLMETLSGDLDPFVRLEDPSGEVILENDDANRDTLNAGFTHTAQTSGEYGVITSNIVNTGGDYQLTVTVTAGTRQDAEDATEDPFQVYMGYMDDAIDDIAYSVTLETGQTVSAVMVALTDALDPYLYLEAPDGERLVENDDLNDDNLDSFLSHTAEFPGEYRLYASNVRNTGGDFELFIITTDAQVRAEVAEINADSPQVSYPLPLVRRQNMNAVIARLKGDLQPVMVLQNPDGETLLESGAETQADMTTRARDEGEYTLTVRGEEDTSGLYLLTIETSDPLVPSSELPDATYTGVMNDDEPEYTYTLTLAAGESVVVSAEALSGDLDTLIYIRNREEDTLIENDDASEDTLNSYLEFTPEVPGEYIVTLTNIYGTSGDFLIEIFVIPAESDETQATE